MGKRDNFVLQVGSLGKSESLTMNRMGSQCEIIAGRGRTIVVISVSIGQERRQDSERDRPKLITGRTSAHTRDVS